MALNHQVRVQEYGDQEITDSEQACEFAGQFEIKDSRNS